MEIKSVSWLTVSISDLEGEGQSPFTGLSTRTS